MLSWYYINNTMDKDLQELFNLYNAAGNNVTYNEFIDAKNQLGDVDFMNYVFGVINSDGSLILAPVKS